MTDEIIEKEQKIAAAAMRSAGIVVTDEEEKNIEIVDFGLGRFDEIGLSILIYINTDRVCAKEMIIKEGQLCPEHYHPPIESLGYPGKEETFRCRKGTVWLYVDGDATEKTEFMPPEDKLGTFTAWHEIKLNEGEQYTMNPGTKHWFIAGKGGAIVSEFSTPSFDLCDVFTDPEISRVSNITDKQ